MRPMIVLVGPSGSGKNYIPETLGMRYCKGHTTRDKRENDPPLTYHNLKEVKELQVMGLFDKKICGETTFHKNFYWTAIEDYNNEEYDYMVLSPEGLMNLVNKYKEHKDIMDQIIKERGSVDPTRFVFRDYEVVYFECSERQRKKNMKKRGDKRAIIKSRIKHDREIYTNEFKQFILGELHGHLIQL